MQLPGREKWATTRLPSRRGALLGLSLAVACSEDVAGPHEPPEPLIAFAINPEGTTDDEVREIFAVRADGTDLRQLTDGLRAFGPAWAPDGSQIAFTSLDPDDPNVFVMNADGSDLKRLTTGSNRMGVLVSWHPEGDELVYGDGTDGSRLHAVADGSMLQTVEVPENFIWWNPSISVDGSRILVHQWHSSDNTGGIYTMDRDGGDLRPVLESPYRHNYFVRPVWQP